MTTLVCFSHQAKKTNIMLRFIGIFLCFVFIEAATPLADTAVAADAQITFDPNCTLKVTFNGLEIPTGGYVRATSGRLNQVYCNAYCTGPGASPALQYFRNGALVSSLASNRIFSTLTTHDRNAILHVQHMIESDVGLYSCKGWIQGQGYKERFFSLLYACPISYTLCDSTRCVENSKICNDYLDCIDETDERGCAPKDCGEDMFACDRGQCYPKAMLCDFFPDCIDGYDESATTCRTCDFRCASGACIDSKLVCNGIPDCTDEDDELNCKTCPEGETVCGQDCLRDIDICLGTARCPVDYDFYVHCPDPCEATCTDGSCIFKTQLCDGNNDCADGVDELNCADTETDNITCYLTCADGSCLDRSDVCDGYKNCEDGMDELNCTDYECGPGEFTCAAGECIDSRLVCDGYPDCMDFRDELNCSSEEETTVDCGKDFLCNDGTCINQNQVCDSNPDCLEGEDENEENCPANVVCSEGTKKCPDGSCVVDLENCARSK